jgi:hypothetical protein
MNVLRRWSASVLAIPVFLAVQGSAFCDSYFALPLTTTNGTTANQKILDRYGVPFIEGVLTVSSNAPGHVDVGGQAKRIFLLGMTESAAGHMWMDPRNYSVRYFVGDDIGQIHLDYIDGSTEIFPLRLGESIWFGKDFVRFSEPFPTSPRLRHALASALDLFPPAPVDDGNYVAVISPKAVPLKSITITSSPAKNGGPLITGITVESAENSSLTGAITLPPANPSSELEKFAKEKSLRRLGENESQRQQQLENLSHALYSNDGDFPEHVVQKMPAGYSGPIVSFKGNVEAEVLANAFHYNVQDIAEKIDADGMYHTSTKGAVSWNGTGFGTFRTNVGMYYNTSWCRDMGRSLQELSILGYSNDAARCADYCLRTAKLWESNPALKVHGQYFPPHWGRVANRPDKNIPYENDGHGMVTMFLYKIWQRMPDNQEWLRSRWPDVKAAGDWILWQFDHPEISGATNGVLHTTGESAGGNGYSVYADYACLEALQALAQMADSIGEKDSARRWRDRVEKMQEAVANQYIINDPKYGRVWTLDHAGWPCQGTVLGPLIFRADYQGFSPQDDDATLQTVNEAAYQRLIDAYRPFGFYGQAMGYGQGFVTESALLLDRMQDATQMLNWIAKQIYDPRFGSFICSEGAQIDPTGRFWYRAGDLGNGVQEAEIIKTLRLVIGVDDTQPNRLQFFPRIPQGWKEIAVEKYPVLFENAGKTETALLRYKLTRSGDRMKLEIASDRKLGPISTRLGPFEKQPDKIGVKVNGEYPDSSVEHSGDSWWVKFIMPSIPVYQ